MVALATADVIGKKAVGADGLAPIKLRILVMAVSAVLGMLMYVFRLGESGLAPWELLVEHPVLLAAVGCIVVSEFLYLVCLRYIGMTIMEAISSMEGVAICVGLLGINLISGKLGAVQEMFIPARLVLILIILFFAVMLPNVEFLANRETATDDQAEGKTMLVTGILIAFLAVIFGCVDSLIADTLLDTGAIAVVDLTMTAYFAQIFMLPVFWFVLAKKERMAKPFMGIVNSYSVGYTTLYVAFVFLGLFASSIDAVRSEIMYLTYPVVAILAARIFLKEQYTWRQNLCIWVITLGAIVFCVVDYLG